MVIIVAVLMTPFPVIILVFVLQAIEIAVFLAVIALFVPLTVGTVFAVIPLVIVLAIAIVNATVFVVVVSIMVVITILRLQPQWQSQRTGNQQRSQVPNGLVLHQFTPW